MLPYIGEFLGTMILILLGCGVCCNVNLDKSGMKGGGTVQITLAWGLAVLVPAFIFGEASGASFNVASVRINCTYLCRLAVPFAISSTVVESFLTGFTKVETYRLNVIRSIIFS